MNKLPQPLNGNILVEVKHDQVKEIFSDADSKKDLQYAEVIATSEGSLLNIGDLIIYNPRALNKINIKDVGLRGILNEGNVIAIM